MSMTAGYKWLQCGSRIDSRAKNYRAALTKELLRITSEVLAVVAQYPRRTFIYKFNTGFDPIRREWLIRFDAIQVKIIRL